MVTFNQRTTVADGGDFIGGIHFNTDGTKMFISYSGDSRFVDEYNLATAFDVSTSSYAGNSERCELDVLGTGATKTKKFDIEFSSDGLKLFIAEGIPNSGVDKDKLYRFDLTSPYDVSTCTFSGNATLNLESGNSLQNESNAGNRTDSNSGREDNRLQGFEINEDGTKLFIVYHGAGSQKPRLLEYTLSTPYDLTTISLNLNAGIALDGQGVSNPMGMRFSPNGKRIWINSHTNGAQRVTQITLDVAYSTSSFTIDGSVFTRDLNGSNSFQQPRGIAFSAAGLKLYIGTDQDNPSDSADHVNELDLICPFNIIEGKCPPVTENSDRTGIAIAQIEVATRTIEHSTDTALNRLKWIRRNKDNQNLTNLNLNFNFTNQVLASLTKAVKTSANNQNKQDKPQDIFYWSEGSIAVGRVGETNVSSFKKVKTDAITIGADKFTKNNGIRGLAFRFGKNDIDVGTGGSNLNTDTYNLTHYTSSPIEDDTKFIDTIIGVGFLNSDILSVLDGKRSVAERNGKQIYGTIKLKDEIKKNNLILIPSAQIDLGYTLLDDYQESGTTAMKFKEQSIQSRNVRLSIAAVDKLENYKYKIRKHGKLEYKANLHRSSNIKYSYVSDATSGEFDTKLNSGALHNVNGELGIDIILPDNFSIFIIYERNQALGVGHTDKIHLAIGYLPNKKTNYAFKLEGSDIIGSIYKISKNLNDFEIDFKLNNKDLLKPNIIDEATISLKKVF